MRRGARLHLFGLYDIPAGVSSDDYQSLRRIEQSGDPSLRGRPAAHRDLAAGRWQAALGARAALEATYQRLAGRPSPAAETGTRMLAECGLGPNPVGLEGRPADTAAFLAELAASTADRDPDEPADATNRRHDHGLDH